MGGVGNLGRRAGIGLLGLSLAFGTARRAAAEDGSPKGKAFPAMSLDHFVAGRPWRSADFAAAVSLLVYFEPGREDFGTTVIPGLQKLRNRFGTDPRFKCFLVLSSAETDPAKIAEQDEAIRKRWGEEKWEIPVMRDSGNLSYLMIAGSPPIPFPLALVLGRDGRVSWVGSIGTPDGTKDMVKGVESAMTGFDAGDFTRTSAGMKATEAAWRSRDLPKAWKEMQKVLDSKASTDTDRDQARLLQDDFQAIVDNEIAMALARQTAGLPHEAMKLLERSQKVLAGVAPAEKITTQIKTMKADKDYLKLLEAEDRLDQALAPLAQGIADRSAVAAALEKVAATFAGTFVATRATELAKYTK